jgi:polyribonucleotide nucleotidyltransferase
MVTVLSVDGEHAPDILALNAVSAAIATSSIPWNGPIGAIRIGLVRGENNEVQYLMNPTTTEMMRSDLDLVVSQMKDKTVMIEAGAKEVPEARLSEAFNEAVTIISALETFQEDIRAKIGKKKLEIVKKELPADVIALVEKTVSAKELEAGLFNTDAKAGIYAVQNKVRETFRAEMPEHVDTALFHLETLVDDMVHEKALNENKRVDGRAFDQVRPLFAQAGAISDNLHGVGIFYRGETHVMSVLTLGSPSDAQIIEGMEMRGKKQFMHHYNFPPFSTGETGRSGNVSRRSVGHGALAEKSLRAIIPDQQTFPYTIRLVSESMASNGSTSMASVCASSLALADGGVPIKRHIAGIAMGIMTSNAGGKLNYKILTDIQGPEDHFGDMDFKVAGTREGVCGIQMDVKVDGVPPAVLVEALTQARAARFHILDTIEGALVAPRATLKPTAPTIVQFPINAEKIGALIGPGGKVIRKVSEDTKTTIEVDEQGIVSIMGKKDDVTAARTHVEALTRVFKEGDIFEGTVKKIFEFGAVVEIATGVEGLVHISEMAPHRVEKVTDIVCPDEKVPVAIKSVDERGKISLSIMKANPQFAELRGKKECTNLSSENFVRYNKEDDGHRPERPKRRY